MFDSVLTPAFFLHALTLLGFWFWATLFWALPRKESPFFTLLFFWATLVLTGHLASIGSHLGDLTAYAPATVAAAGLLFFLFRFVGKIPERAPLVSTPCIPFASINSPKIKKLLFWFLFSTLLLFAVVSFVLGMSVYPDNADSMIYRLPRAFWYVSHGSFLHPFDSLDKRLVFYPINGVALYIPFVLYGLPGTFHSIPSLLSWAVVVYVSYRFARELGADRLFSLFASWLVGLTPSVLAQATSTNDEIIAAAALLSSLYMGWRWLRTGAPLYFVTACLALALSAGTKLHIVFLLPILFLAFLAGALHLRKNPKDFRRWLASLSPRTGLVSLLVLMGFFLPFLFYNYESTGRFYFLNDFKNDVFNLSASLKGGLQNLLIYASQMLFSPIADLNFWPVANDRQVFNTHLNRFFSPFLAPLIDLDPSFYHLGYRFNGITLPVSVRFVEFSLWSAFVWLLWPIQTSLLLRQKKLPLKPFFLLLALTPPLWLFFWSFSTLYMEGTATYFTFYLVCAAPAAVFSFTAAKTPLRDEIRWVVLVFVTLSHLLIDHNLVMYSGFRALPDLFYAAKWPYDWLLTEQPVIDELRNAKEIRIAFTHEKLPYFGYMHWNPRAYYFSPFSFKDNRPLPERQKLLQVFPVSGLYMYGFMPLKIKDKAAPGLTYLGLVRAIGREAIFAMGNDVEKRHPTESQYILLGATFVPLPTGQWKILFAKEPIGLLEEDRLTFEHEVKKGSQRIFYRPENKDPSFELTIDGNLHEVGLKLTTVVRSAWSRKEVARETFPLGGLGMWLPEGGEY